MWNYFSARTLPVQRVGSASSRPAKGAPAPAAAAATGASGGIGPRDPSQMGFFNTHAAHFSPMQQPAVAPDAEADVSGVAPGSSPLMSPGSAGSQSSSSSASRQRLGAPNSSFVPPLYFQHQGHSRTIIGILRNEKTGRFRLLVLDPDMSGGGVQLLQNLSSSNPRPVVQAALKTLYRNEDNLRAKEYQMVMIASYGLMTPQEQQRSKRPFSTVISAVETPRQESPDANEPKPAQQTGPQLEQHHDRGAGGRGGGGGGDAKGKASAASSSSSSSSSRRWKLERRELDERAPARQVGDLDSSSLSPSAARDRSPATVLLDDSEEHSPEGRAADRLPPVARRSDTAADARAKGAQAQVQQDNLSSQRRFAEQRGGGQESQSSGQVSSASVVSSSPSSACLSYREHRGIPVIPPSRSRLPLVARLPAGPRTEPRALSAAPKLTHHTHHTHMHHLHTHANNNQGAPQQHHTHTTEQQRNRATHAAETANAGAQRSCTRVPAGLRLLQTTPPKPS